LLLGCSFFPLLPLSGFENWKALMRLWFEMTPLIIFGFDLWL